MGPSDDRERLILRRTLSAIAWLYAMWNVLLGLPVALTQAASSQWGAAWGLVGHGGLLAAAGIGLWKPRRWGWPAAFAAAAVSLAFVGRDLRNGNPGLAVVDGAWPALAIAIFLLVRPPRA